MDPASQPARMIAYLRVSTDEQAESGLGLEAQDRAIMRAFEYRGWELAGVARDEGISGSTLERPGLLGALKRIAADDADGLVVAKLDRLSRSMRDYCELVDWFEDATAVLVMLEPDIDTSSPYGRGMAQVMVTFAEMERRLIADRTRAAMASKRERGEPIGRPSVTDQPELVERIHALKHDEGLSLSKICARLEADGVPTPRGGLKWRPSSLQTVLGYQRPTSRRKHNVLPEIPAARRRRRR